MSLSARNALEERVLALYESGGSMYGVADGRIQTAIFDIIPTRPGFDPHESVRTEKGLEGSYFWLWEHLFDTNPFHSTVCEVMRDLLIGQGFALTSTTPEDMDAWETWKRESKFIEVMSVALLDLFRMGNMFLLNYRETPDVMALRLQTIPVRGMFPIFNEERTEVIAWDYRITDHQNQFDPVFSVHPGTRLEAEDVSFVSINRLPGTVFGRAVNYQAFGEYIGLKDLHRVAGIIAARQTSRFIVWNVDTTDLSGQNSEDTADQSKRKDSPALQKMKAVKSAVENRVLINRDTGETRVVDNIIVDETVTGTDLTGTADLKGLNDIIDTFKKTVDRKARIPPVFLATPDGSNRATSYNELIVFTIMMKGFFRFISSEIERVILPELRLSGEIVPQEEIIQEDEAVKSQMIDALLNSFDRGVMSRDEVREQIERLLTIGLKPTPPESADHPETAPPPSS